MQGLPNSGVLRCQGVYFLSKSPVVSGSSFIFAPQLLHELQVIPRNIFVVRWS